MRVAFRSNAPLGVWILLSSLLLLGVSALGLWWGSVDLTLATVVSACLKGIQGQPLNALETIVWDIRFPRVVLGIVVGAALSMSGAAYQAVFRNPLADPYLMGVASGGALGATLALMHGWPRVWVPGSSFVVACLSVFVTVILARRGTQVSPLRLILAGVVVGGVVTALSTYLLLGGGDRIREVMAWTLGSLSLGSWEKVAFVWPYVAVCGFLLVWMSPLLDTLQLGEVTAHSLGLPVQLLRVVVILLSTLMTAAAVSQVGIIGFVGLVTPHIVRRLVGAHFAHLLPLSAIGGGILLVSADLAAKTLAKPTEIPIGILTTLLGGPFFLYLLRRQP